MKARSSTAARPGHNMTADPPATRQHPLNGTPAAQALSSHFRTKTFLQTIKDTTRFRMAWLRHRHPDWKIADIIQDMSNWYDKEIPQDVVVELKRFMREEWRKKSFQAMDAASFDPLFNTDATA